MSEPQRSPNDGEAPEELFDGQSFLQGQLDHLEAAGAEGGEAGCFRWLVMAAVLASALVLLALVIWLWDFGSGSEPVEDAVRPSTSRFENTYNSEGRPSPIPGEC